MRLDVLRHRTIKGDKMRARLLLSAVAAAAAAVTLNAQVTPAKPDSSCTNYPDGRVECRVFRGGARGDSALRNRFSYRMDSAMAKRAALGLELRTTGTRRDTLGVFVEAVTPKGPAETAGIIEGDRIASINGVDLRTSAGDTEDSYANGLAAHRLSREVQKLSPGSRVNLRVYSGGRLRDVQVTAGTASDVMRLGNRFRFMMPGMDGMFDGPADLPNDLPSKIQIRAPMRIRTPAPVRALRTYRVDASDIEPVSPELIRELVATTIRNAQSALKQLAADGIS
jgi:hypothetical protein